MKNTPNPQAYAEPVDYRWIGPVVTCPRCTGDQFLAMVILDPETLDIATFGLDGSCLQCGALIKLACPADHVLMEASHRDRSATLEND